MSRKYFGTDGIRGRVGEDLITPEFILRLGWAAGRVLGNRGKVVIGKDTRISGYMFEAALEAGLAAAGVDVLLTGPMPTPGVAYLTRTFHANAGIVISASHNPYHDNGIKFFSADGSKLDDAVEQAIETELDQPMRTVASEQLGRARRITDAAGRYIEFCKSTIAAQINLRGLKIVVDCAHGATYHITPNVLRELGAEVIAIGDRPDGLNINAAVGSTHPEALQQAVLANHADLGVALDGDGDRLLLVAADGRVLDGDDILYIIAVARQAQQALRGPVVGTIMTNLGLEQALAQLGLALERTAVGDRYILERMAQADFTLGGEPSGHIICRDRTTTGDGTVAMLQVLAELVASGKSLAELSCPLTKLPQVLVNVPLGQAVAAEVMQRASVQQQLQLLQKKLAQRGRILLRPSGTEPLIRVMVEGEDAAQVSQLANELADSIRLSL